MAEQKQWFLSAYYYSFQPTGVDEIDAILEAIAKAGKAYHHTEEWSESPFDGGPSFAERIQLAANAAAEVRAPALAAEVERLRGEIRAIELRVDGLNTKGQSLKKGLQSAVDAIKAHCRAALKREGEG